MDTKSSESDDYPKPRRGEENAEQACDIMSYGGNILLSFGLRHYVQNCSRLDRFLLDYNGCFLWVVSVILWTVCGFVNF